jgi:hypothetical protein
MLEMRPYLAPKGSNDPNFNIILDLETSENLISIPLVLKEQLPLGVLQISGKLRMIH